MTDPTQSDAAHIRVLLDHGEVVELDGGTLNVDGEVAGTVLLRLVPWRARSLARVLDEWSVISRLFNPRATQVVVDELDLSRTLATAASALDADEPAVRFSRGPRVVPSRQRLMAVAALAEYEDGLSALQRLAVIDAASWWLSEENGGEELAHALLGATCMTETATQHAYLALIGSLPDPSDDHSEGLPS
jgi:hypothetical protein